MSISSITKHLLKELKEFGDIDWHESKHSSRYIKFRDTRLGSIRIADHKGRSKYSYTYELTDISTEEEINEVINSIKFKSMTINGFDPKNFIVYDSKIRAYITLSTFKEYKDHVLRKTIRVYKHYKVK